MELPEHEHSTETPDGWRRRISALIEEGYQSAARGDLIDGKQFMEQMRRRIAEATAPADSPNP